jgi:hypothetical protein
MRYTKNTISANLSYVAIALNALYFISIYSSDVKSYYYNIEIGVSVIYNLLFMLFVFLASEGVKKYDAKYAVLLTVIGALQIVRIFGIPLNAYYTFIELRKNQYLQVMESDQFILCIIYLSISAICAIVGGIIGLIKSKKLAEYEKNLATE